VIKFCKKKFTFYSLALNKTIQKVSRIWFTIITSLIATGQVRLIKENYLPSHLSRTLFLNKIMEKTTIKKRQSKALNFQRWKKMSTLVIVTKIMIII